MSDRIRELAATMEDSDLLTLRARNARLAEDYRLNADRMDTVVRVLDQEIIGRGLAEPTDYANGHTYDRT